MGQFLLQQVLGQDIIQSLLLAGQHQEGGQRRGQRQKTGHGLILGLVLEGEDQVELVVIQMGEGVSGVHDLGRQNGKGVIFEPLVGITALGGVHLLADQAAHPLLGQLFLDGGEDLIPLGVIGPAEGVDLLELFGGGETGLAVRLIVLAQGGDVGEGTHPDHKKLVQVALEDGHEFQPLVEGIGLVLRLLQHPAVELEPGELPVLGIAQIPGKLSFGILFL